MLFLHISINMIYDINGFSKHIILMDFSIIK